MGVDRNLKQTFWVDRNFKKAFWASSKVPEKPPGRQSPNQRSQHEGFQAARMTLGVRLDLLITNRDFLFSYSLV